MEEVKIYCLTCGGKIKVNTDLSIVKRYKVKYCSQNCYFEKRRTERKERLGKFWHCDVGHHKCKICQKMADQKYRKDNWLKIKERKRLESKTPTAKFRLFKSSLKRLYNITPEYYKTLLELQHNKCAICQKQKRLVVDHCHETKVVRGLLCFSCNTSLGQFGDNITGIKNVLSYLEKNHGRS